MAISAGLLDYRPSSATDIAELAKRYETGGWDYLAGIHQLSQYSLLAGYISFLRCRSILDVGCGAGLLRARMSGVDFARYVGVDPVPAAIEQAQHLADERTTFRVGDAFLPELGRFDAVVCNEVLYGVLEPLPLIEHLRALMRPGGYLLTSNLRHTGDRALFRMLEERYEIVADVDVTSRTDRGVRKRRISVYRSA
jgi:2-polyprenyl-3-methyl-5-hydroxy-6-metoxy-1,4-benzoquinol methylase